MKLILSRFWTLIVALYLSISVSAQPWMKYYSPPKSATQEESFRALKDAFEKYWENREPGHGSGYKPFMRWAWMMDERISAEGKIPQGIVWTEYLKEKERLASKGGPVNLGDWAFIGPEQPPTDIGTGQVIGSGRVDCIAFHPYDTNVFFIGSPTGGLWKTADNGLTWTPLTDDLPGLGIADIAIHPTHPDTIYIATGDRDAGEIYAAGVLKSYDGGTTWQGTSMVYTQADNYVVNRLLINPVHPDTLIAATNNGIFFLTQGGSASVKVIDGHFKDLEFKPGNPEIVYAATYNYGNASVYKSTNGGKNFTVSSSGMNTANIRRIDLAVTPDRPDMVMALCSDKESSGLHAIYRSFNEGNSWTSLLSGGTKNILATEPDGTGTGGQGWYDLTLAVSPSNYAEIFSGGVNIWRTLNGGGSWEIASFGYPEWGVSSAPYVHVDQHILKYHPVTGALFSGNDGGLYRSYDKGKSWQDLTANLGILQVYRIGASPQKKSLVMMGSQDNSSIMTTDTNWYVVLGGDGMECIVDYSDTNTLYASSQYGSLGRSDDGGLTFKSVKPDGVDKGAWVTPYVMHPRYPEKLFAGYSEIYASSNKGNSWTQLTSNLSSGINFSHLAISSFNPDVIYAAASTNCWRSDDEGKTWTNIRNGMGPGVVKYFAIHQYDAHQVWVALSNYSAGEKVYYSADGGDTWTNYSDGLPNVPVNCLVFQDNSNSTLYAGTDLGVYYRNRSMDQWEPFKKGLPNVIVNEMEIYAPDSVVRAATYGRGLWESPLLQPDSTLPWADFTVDKRSSCIGSPFKFLYKGSESPDSIQWTFGADANPKSVKNADTAVVEFSQEGWKDATLVVYKNGMSDTLYRTAYVNSVSTISPSITASFDTYFWRGNQARLEAHGADSYSWSPAQGLDTVAGNVVHASPDSTITYYVDAVQGSCQGRDSIFIEVYPNDHIRYALPLSMGTNGPFINNGATVEQDEPIPPAGDCNTQTTWCDEFSTGQDILGHTVWFTFTGPASGVISIDSWGFDEQIAVYSADNADSLLSGAYSLLAANDDYHDASMNYAAAIEEITGLSEGKTYWVQVDGSGGNSEGEFYLRLYDTPLGIKKPENIPNHGELNVYPNPNGGRFEFSLNRSVTRSSLIRVYSISGALVLEKTLDPYPAGSKISLNLPDARPGMYLLMIITHKEILKERFVIH